MAESGDLKKAFEAFSKFGDTKSTGKTITLTQCDKWFKQANIIDGKKITTTDTGICFNKHKSKTIDFDTFKKYVEDLASSKKMDADELYNKLVSCGAPGTAGTTFPDSAARGAAKSVFLLSIDKAKVSKTGAVDRLTDTSLYTGAHKERFDASGKGKGIEGRADVADNSGYVSGYKEKDTFDKKH